MNRRELITLVGAAIGASLPGSDARAAPTAAPPSESRAEGSIMTVRGPIDPADAGVMLPHEHLMSRFAGASPERRPDYDVRDLFKQVVPYLEKVRELGVETIADATGAYFGRDALILRRLSEITDVHVITNTGYYGAADDRFVPEHAYTDTADELADRWIGEWLEGVEGTGIQPGFIKTAVDSEPLSEIDAKLIRAASIAHLETGLTIAVHTSGLARAARQQLDILAEEGVSPEAWVWVHAHNADDLGGPVRAAEQGAWISFDGIGADTAARHVELVGAMHDRGLAGRVLLAHDGNSYPLSGSPRPYEHLFSRVIPGLRNAGLDEAWIRRLTVENPRDAFTVRVRAR